MSEFRDGLLNRHLLWQSLLSTVVISLVILAFSLTRTSRFDWAIGVGALSSTAYILFISPSSRAASFYSFMCSYFVALVLGFTLHLISLLFQPEFNLLHAGLQDTWLGVVLFFYMIITSLLKAYHPPAAGLAIVLSVEGFNINTVSIVVITVILLSIMKFFLRKSLKNLFD